MFKCLECNSVDQISLLAAKNYSGKGTITQYKNENFELVICIDHLEFVPDLKFINSHGACAWCGATGQWIYYFEEKEKASDSSSTSKES